MSEFEVGAFVTIGGAAGDYFGQVVDLIDELTKSTSAFDDTQMTKPGIVVDVYTWGGMKEDDMQIEVWDSEATEVLYENEWL